MLRARCLRRYGWLLFWVCLYCNVTATQPEYQQTSLNPQAPPNLPILPQYGAEANPTGNPLGGGSGYNHILLTGDYVVETKDQFLTAIKQAQSGGVVYLAPQAEIDLTGMQNIEIPAGITIAGNRGYNGSSGPLIYTNQLNTYPLFNAAAPGVRITGIRLRGPDFAKPDSIAIRIMGDNAEIDNCEIYNWSYAGIAILRAQNAYIHHSYIHHVQRPGLGYPVVFDTATGLVEANIFDYYRHAIAATGTKGTGYEARYNLVLPNAINHAFDMHGGTDFCPTKQNVNCTEQDVFMAGDYVNIHHNTFLITSYDAIRIRGVSRQYVDIHHNWFIDPNPEKGLRYRYYHGGNAKMYQNVFGPGQRLVEVSVTPSPFVYLEGSETIVGLANEGAISFGFADVKGLTQAALRDKVPIKLLPVAAGASVGESLQVTGVVVRLDGAEVYRGNNLPQTNELTIDTRQLADGTHELQLEITTSLGFPLRQTIHFQSDNWWDLSDDITAPSVSGWFGVIDTAKTSSVSGGWTYATDNPEAYGGDIDRRVRLRNTDEYLIWETPDLQHYRIIVYSSTSTAEGISISISTDQSAWLDIVPRVKADEVGMGRFRLELSGSLSDLDEAHWFRLTLTGGLDPDALQVGEAHFRGRL